MAFRRMLRFQRRILSLWLGIGLCGFALDLPSGWAQGSPKVERKKSQPKTKSRGEGAKRRGGANAADPHAGPATPSRDAAAFQILLNSTDERTTWSGQSLREGLDSLAEAAQISIWLDRRVDPGQPIEFSRQGSLDERLHSLAAQLDLGVCYVETVAYLGPPELTARLATVAAVRTHEVKSSPEDIRTRLTAEKADQWPALATPRELVERWAGESGVDVQGLALIPHDLWPSIRLPRLSVSDRLSLALAGFDLTFELDAAQNRLRLVPLPATPVIAQSYSLGSAATDGLERLQEKWPAAELRREGRKLLHVSGTMEVHREVQEFLRGGKPRASTHVQHEKQPTFDLKVEASARQVLDKLASSFGLRLEVSPELAPQLETRISINVTKATRDELLAKVLGDVRLTFQIRGESLVISRPE